MMFVVCVSIGGSAQAQEVPRPFRGLFRASDDPRNARQQVELAGTLFAGWVQADIAAPPVLVDQRLLNASYVGVGSVLAYGFMGRIATVESLTGGTWQHYSTLPGFRPTRYFERAQLRVKVRPHTEVRLRGDVLYSPYYSLGLTGDPDAEAGALTPDAQEPFVLTRENIRVDAQVEIVHRPSPRSEVAADYIFADTKFLNEGFHLRSHQAGVRYRRNMTEHAHLRLGYRFQQWSFAEADAPTLRGHDINVGIDYNRALPSSPRTRVGVDFGSTVAKQPGTTRVDVTGAAFIARRLSPLWVTSAVYTRAVDARAGITQPVYFFSNTAALSLAGIVARRALVRLVGSYVRGTFSAGPLDDHSRSWNGTAGVSFRLKGVTALFAQATASTLRVSERLRNITGLPVMVDRVAVTGGLTIWLPLVR
ncbi:MAG: hypothetical protein ABI818_09730 [Acidobacteriota bacterium]